MPRVFLMMPFQDELDWLRTEIVDAGADVSVAVERADDIFAAGVIIDQVKERIAGADAVIAVCTGRNANVFYELGISEHYHEAILIAESTDDLPFDVRQRRALLYGGPAAGQDRATLRERVARAIVETIQERADRLSRFLATEPLHEEIEAARPAESVRLDAELMSRGSSGSYLLEIRNSGDVPLRNVRWEIPEEARWHDLTSQVLPEYPVRELPPGEHVRVPIVVAMGSQMAATVRLQGETPDGESYERSQLLTIYG